MILRARLISSIVVTTAILFTVFGSITWKGRFEERVLPKALRDLAPHSLTSIIGNEQTLIAACDAARKTNSWLLLLISAEVRSDDKYRGFFETAPESRGLFMEYDPRESGNLRVGMAYGSGEGLLPSTRTIRRNTSIEVAILVSNSRTLRVVSGATDKSLAIPELVLSNLACDAPVVGSADGIPCNDCDVEILYGYGEESGNPNRILNEYADSDPAFQRGALGTFFTLLGLYMLTNSRRLGVRLAASRRRAQ